jgi:hypothetical protein
LDGNPRALGVTYAKVTGGRWSAVFLVNILDTRPIGRYDLLRLVRRTVVNDDELEILESLAENAVDGLPKIIGSIIGGDDDRYLGRTGHGLTLWTQAVDFDFAWCCTFPTR